MDAATVHRRRWLILAVLSVSVFLVVVDNTIVNVALPTLNRELGASVSRAAVDRRRLHPRVRRPAARRRRPRRPVRPQGRHADRPGRSSASPRPLGAFATSAGQLIAARARHGHRRRARSSRPRSRSSPTSSPTRPSGPRPSASGRPSSGLGGRPRPDHRRLPARALLVGLGLPRQRADRDRRPGRPAPCSCPPPVTPRSAASTSSARCCRSAPSACWSSPSSRRPRWGWTSTATLAGFAAAAAAARRLRGLGAAGRPSRCSTCGSSGSPASAPAAAAIAVAFFALFGFIFLVTQYFQFVKGYSTLSAGLHTLPFAIFAGVTAPDRRPVRPALRAPTGGRAAGLLVDDRRPRAGQHPRRRAAPTSGRSSSRWRCSPWASRWSPPRPPRRSWARCRRSRPASARP